MIQRFALELLLMFANASSLLLLIHGRQQLALRILQSGSNGIDYRQYSIYVRFIEWLYKKKRLQLAKPSQ
jgi:hypothetical protein